MKKDDNLFYTCSLIEYMGRKTRNTRKAVVNKLKPDIKRIYDYADVFHCEPMEKVCSDFAERNMIDEGEFDAEAGAKYAVPSYWEIGKVFEHIIEDACDGKDKTDAISEVFSSWLADKILDYNSDLYYQPREYLAECYREGRIVEA